MTVWGETERLLSIGDGAFQIPTFDVEEITNTVKAMLKGGAKVIEPYNIVRLSELLWRMASSSDG